jgi:hypothetical protein
MSTFNAKMKEQVLACLDGHLPINKLPESYTNQINRYDSSSNSETKNLTFKGDPLVSKEYNHNMILDSYIHTSRQLLYSECKKSSIASNKNDTSCKISNKDISTIVYSTPKYTKREILTSKANPNNESNRHEFSKLGPKDFFINTQDSKDTSILHTKRTKTSDVTESANISLSRAKTSPKVRVVISIISIY